MVNFPFKPWRKAVLAIVLCGITSFAAAGSFQLWEQSAAGTGDYHAGGAAEADDASTEFYNPAGMIRLAKPQLSLGLVYIPLDVKFDGTVNTIVNGQQQTNGYVKGDTNNFVPNFHIVYPVNQIIALGFGVTTPFGLKTDYPDIAPSNQAATLTDLKTVNLNPNIAFKINNHLSFGLGFDALYADAEYNQQLEGTVQSLLGPINFTDNLDNTVSDWGYGWNTGLLYQFNNKTRVGFSYRSHIQFQGTGTSTANLGISSILGNISPTLANTNLKGYLTLPPTYTASIFSQVSKKWALLFSAYFTQWSDFHEITLDNVVGDPTINDVFNYKNSWNLVWGAHYSINRQWMLKGGFAWDQSPTRDGYRDIRLPDTDRYVLAAGVHWQFRKDMGFDLGYSHLFTGDITVNNTLSGAPVTEFGTAKTETNVIGLQYTANI